MKKEVKTKVLIVAIVLVLTVLLLIPFVKRIRTEVQNDNVTVSLYYSQIEERFRGETLDEVLQEYLEVGVTNANVSEQALVKLADRGLLTNLTYGELCHKYDEESIVLADLIEKEVPQIIYGSQLILTKDEEMASFIRKGLSERYEADEYAEVSGNDGMNVFAIFEGNLLEEEILLGYDESAIKMLKEKGFDLTLNVKLQNFSKTDYLHTMEQLIQKYDIRYLALQKSKSMNPDNPEDGKAHYEELSRIIEENNVVLIVQEAFDHVSNDKPFGYDEIFAANSDQVLRSYGAHAVEIKDTNYMYRYSELVNSTIDRNIRFIMLTQIDIKNKDYSTIHEYTVEVIGKYIEKIQDFGYTVNEEPPVFDYDVNRRTINAVAAAIMVLLVYLMFILVTGYQCKKLSIAAFTLSTAAFLVSFVMPSALMVLYSTAWSVIMPCFAITIVFSFVKKYRDKMNTILFVIAVPILTVAVMYMGGIVISSLLSGIDYYVNNSIFRGVKLSLLVPIAYSMAAYYWMFVKEDRSVIQDIKTVLLSDIKVYWVLLAGAVGVVGMIYIIRSGNVESISSFETAMRNFLTNTFAARPRTKEFLIGYPCLVLFAYYAKKIDIKLIQAVLAAGSSILFASVSNSYCHVFTDVSTIYMRVLNGMLVGALISIVAYVVNLLLVKIVKFAYKYVKDIND